MAAGSGRDGDLPPVLRSYLEEFEAVAYQLPAYAQQDVRSRIWRECAKAAVPGGRDPQRLDAVLAELGPARDLVAAELERLGRRPDRFRPSDSAPIPLLASSVLTLGVGALVGLVMLWRSPVWPLHAKITAPVLVAAAVLALLPVNALPPLAAVLLGGLAVGPAVAALHLLLVRRAVRR